MAGAIMTGMTPEKSGKNLIRPDFPDPNGIPAGKALYSSNFSRFPGRKLCSGLIDGHTDDDGQTEEKQSQRPTQPLSVSVTSRASHTVILY